MVAIRTAVPDASLIVDEMNPGVQKGWRHVASYWRI